jgi:transketolase
MGWQRYVGQDGLTVSMTGYGASAPGGTNMEQNGFTVDNIVETALKVSKQ